MAVTVVIAVTQLIRGVITAVTSTADAVMTGLLLLRQRLFPLNFYFYLYL